MSSRSRSPSGRSGLGHLARARPATAYSSDCGSRRTENEAAEACRTLRHGSPPVFGQLKPRPLTKTGDARRAIFGGGACGPSRSASPLWPRRTPARRQSEAAARRRARVRFETISSHLRAEPFFGGTHSHRSGACPRDAVAAVLLEFRLADVSSGPRCRRSLAILARERSCPPAETRRTEGHALRSSSATDAEVL